MEAVREEDGLLDKIRPPRLEDAGLEDCALPPDSIKEAFLKAATAVRSRAASVLSSSDADDEPDCVNDPWPNAGELSDALIGVTQAPSPPGPCGTKKGGGLPEAPGDDVAAGVTDATNDEGRTDEVVDQNVPEGGTACVEGLLGLKIQAKPKNDDDGEEEKDSKRPILAEAYI